MKLCESTACIVVLTESDVTLKINDYQPIKIPAKHLVLISCEGNHIDFSSLNKKLVAYIDRETIKSYIHFIDKKITEIPPYPKNMPPCIYQPCRTPEVFKEAAIHSTMQTNDKCEIERTRSLLFTVLSIFLNDERQLSLLMKTLPLRISERVQKIIESDIQKDWNLDLIAGYLYMSPSSLKKKLKNENTSYSQIVTQCRMHYAADQLLNYNNNISNISLSCGYHSTSYFISVFKSFYGKTPLSYVKDLRHCTDGL